MCSCRTSVLRWFLWWESLFRSSVRLLSWRWQDSVSICSRCLRSCSSSVRWWTTPLLSSRRCRHASTWGTGRPIWQVSMQWKVSVMLLSPLRWCLWQYLFRYPSWAVLPVRSIPSLVWRWRLPLVFPVLMRWRWVRHCVRCCWNLISMKTVRRRITLRHVSVKRSIRLSIFW